MRLGLERLQAPAFWVGLLGLLVGTLAGGGIHLLPTIPAIGIGWLWLLATALGIAGGVAATRRFRAVERERWRWAEEPGVSRGERELAHREAERNRRAAGRAWFLAPMGLAYWICWQIEPPLEPLHAGFLLMAPMVGFGLGLLVGRRAGSATER